MKIIISVIVLFLWSSIDAQIRPEYSGMWYNPDQDGHGLNLEVLDCCRSAGFWYMYDQNGRPYWLLLQGNNVGDEMVLSAYSYYGMIPHEWNPDTLTSSEYGRVVIEFHDCMRATVTMTQNLYVGYRVWDSIPMERLTHIAGMGCGTDKPFDTLLDEYETVLDAIAAASPWSVGSIPLDGTISYGDINGCNYSAQISVDADDDSIIYLTTLDSNRPSRCPVDPSAPLSGRFHTDYEVCGFDLLGGDQNCFIPDDVVMVFTVCEGGDPGCNPDGEYFEIYRRY